MQRSLAFSAFLIFYLSTSTLFAASTAISESARKEAAGQPPVIAERIDDLKQDVLNKKTQMLIFRQLLKSEGIESSLPTLVIKHLNQMSARYQVFSIAYSIDNERVFSYFADDRSGLERKPSAVSKNLAKEIDVFKGTVSPGTHDLSVEIIYKGNDAGVFSYINDYKIPSQVTKSFKVEKGQNLDIQVIGYEKGWALTEFKDRPDLKINFRSAKHVKDLK